MQTVSVQTTQNIELEYPLAGIGDRLLAFAIDLVIVFSFYVIVFSIIGFVGGSVPAAISISLVILGYLYRFFAELLFNGQTVGKNVMKIRVVKLDGSQPSVASYFLRWLLEPIDFFISGLAVLIIVVTPKGQRIGDLLAGTTVVKIKKVTATNIRNKTILQKVDETYEPVFPSASLISDQEINIIKDALKAYRDDAVQKPITILEMKLKEKYEIQSDLPTVKFLYTLVRDNAYYVSK